MRRSVVSLMVVLLGLVAPATARSADCQATARLANSWVSEEYTGEFANVRFDVRASTDCAHVYVRYRLSYTRADGSSGSQENLAMDQCFRSSQSEITDSRHLDPQRCAKNAPCTIADVAIVDVSCSGGN